MKKIGIFLTIIFLIFFAISCQKDNQPPVINNIIIGDEYIYTGSEILLECAATDPENDLLQFRWNSEYGRFKGKTDSTAIIWESPDEPGNYEISVTVNDEINETTKKQSVEVVETANFSGYIFFTGTKIPVIGANFIINKSAFQTDENGFFSLKISPGNYHIQIIKNSTVLNEEDVIVKQGNNPFTFEISTDELNTTLSGTIINSFDKQPISGAQIELLNPDGTTTLLVAESNEYGFFEFTEIPIGMRNFKVWHNNYQPLTGIYTFTHSPKQLNFELKCNPPTIQLISGKSIGLDSVFLEAGILSECAQNYTAGFCYSEVSYPDINDNIILVSPQNNTIKTLVSEEKFERLKNYYYRAFIQTEDDIFYSDEYSFSIGVLSDTRENPTRYYITTKIGDQTWMAENLAYLPEVNKRNQISTDEARYYVFDYDDINVAKAKNQENYYTYGVLYNWTAAKNICPEGWHLPTNNDWEELSIFISEQNGGYRDAGSFWSNVGLHLKATVRWENNGVGTDDYGFSGIPGGFYSFNTIFYNLGKDGYWWTGDESSTFASYRYMNSSTKALYKGSSLKSFGFSVRCIKD